MLNQATFDKLYSLRLPAMARELERQTHASEIRALSFEERLGLLVDAEWSHREQRRLKRRLRHARLRYPAAIEDVDFKARRGLDRGVLLALAECGWIREHHNVLITGSTGVGKSYLACALAQKACRMGMSAYYVRAPRLLQDLAVSRGDGTYGRCSPARQGGTARHRRLVAQSAEGLRAARPARGHRGALPASLDARRRPALGQGVARGHRRAHAR